MVLSGTLLLPTGKPFRNAFVKLVAKSTSEQVLKTASSGFNTNADGEYSIDCPFGSYSVVLFGSNGNTTIGGFTIDADTTETSINELIILGDTAISTPLVNQVREDAVAAEASKNAAIASAMQAATSEQAAVGSLQAVQGVQLDVTVKAESVASNTTIVKDSTVAAQLAETNAALSVQASQAGAQTAATEADRAEAAADSAQLSAHVYPTSQEGLENTPVGQFYSVASEDANEYLSLFKNNNGVAEFIKTYPSKGYIDNIDEYVKNLLQTDQVDGVLFSICDAERNRTWMEAESSFGGPTTLSLTHLERSMGVSMLHDVPGYSILFADSAGYLTDLAIDDVTGQFKQFVIERLATRIEPLLSGNSTASYPPTAHNNITDLRKMRMKMAQIKAGDAAQLDIAFIGDSYTAGHLYYLNKLTKALASEFGFSGPGYIGFNHGASMGDTNFQYTRSSSTFFGGSWLVSELGAASPDNRTITAGAVGDYVQINAVETAGISTTVTNGKLLYLGNGSNPTVRYRWGDTLPWNTLTLSGTGVQSIILPVMPVGGAWKLRMEVVTGLPTLFGFYLSNNVTGLRTSKLAASGSATGDWYKPTDAAWMAQWKASVSLIPADVYFVMLGGNDQSASVSPATYLENIKGIYATLREINPSADIHITIRQDTSRVSTYPMSAYAAPVRAWAWENTIPCSDMQYAFGTDPKEYASNGVLPLIGTDNTHPDPATGGRVITEFFNRLMLAAQ